MGKGPAGASPGLGQVGLLIGYAQVHSDVGVLGRDLQAAMQEFSPLIELAEVHVEEAQVVEEIEIVGVLADIFSA